MWGGGSGQDARDDLGVARARVDLGVEKAVDPARDVSFALCSAGVMTQASTGILALITAILIVTGTIEAWSSSGPTSHTTLSPSARPSVAARSRTLPTIRRCRRRSSDAAPAGGLVALFQVKARIEEGLLADRFPGYRQYARHTPAWLPAPRAGA